jgi:hypothetical protein
MSAMKSAYTKWDMPEWRSLYEQEFPLTMDKKKVTRVVSVGTLTHTAIATLGAEKAREMVMEDIAIKLAKDILAGRSYSVDIEKDITDNSLKIAISLDILKP